MIDGTLSRIAVGGCLLAGMLLGQSALAVQTGDKFKDWQVRCENPPGVDKPVCFIYQSLINDKDQPVLQMAVGYWPINNKPVAIFTTPLGVSLRGGVEIRIDGTDIGAVPYERCDSNGCIAGLPLADEHLAKLKGGSKCQIKIYDAVARPVTLEISLSGFTAGFSALR